MLISNLLQIIFLIIFLKKGLDSIKQYMINYSNKNEGKNIKNDINEINTKIEYKNRKIKSKIDDNKNSKKNNKKILIDSPSSFSQSKLLSKRQANVIGFMGQPIFQLDKNYIILKEKKKKKKNNRNNIETIGDNKDILNYPDNELEEMNYEKAIIYDKRSYLKLYWSSLLGSQIILNTFCTDNNLNLFIIKLSFFIFIFELNFFLNALFYTDEYISNAYYNKGILDFT